MKEDDYPDVQRRVEVSLFVTVVSFRVWSGRGRRRVACVARMTSQGLELWWRRDEERSEECRVVELVEGWGQASDLLLGILPHPRPRRENFSPLVFIQEEKEQKEAWKVRKEENRATGQKQSYSNKNRVLTPRRGRASLTIWPHPTPNA
ncbi:hypothetical protein PIB30_096919 [Stylosanthes scabra]|uniref:Uncharacterized protein n=1 Tax=Stylosanthes scabra TaxID=79078 RepID=A0ABU6VUJ2_9FABA|nr:hypothetical protein [Stylosanthes scabra]